MRRRESHGGRGYNLGQAKGTGNLMADLHFTYRDEPAKLCCELKNLKEDEIAVGRATMDDLFYE